MNESGRFEPSPGDALVVVDVQRDFLPGRALAVPGGDEVIAPLNGYSGFDGTDLDERMRAAGARRLLIGGLTMAQSFIEAHDGELRTLEPASEQADRERLLEAARL